MRSSTGRPSFDIWGIPLPAWALTAREREYLSDLPEHVPDLAWVCDELDRVWEALELDNRRPLANQPVEEFYRHPVWLMVGLYSAADPVSVRHRTAIASHVSKLEPRRVVDVGGGFGELALQISEAVPAARVEIWEPFPSPVAQARLKDSGRDVQYQTELQQNTYDIVIAQDVLEHVEEPIELAVDLVRAVRPGGVAVFANNFTPIQQCHLPQTFHLRRTFPLVMRALGLVPRGRVEGAEHALLFERSGLLYPQRARRAEEASRVAAPMVRVVEAVRKRTRALLSNLRCS